MGWTKLDPEKQKDLEQELAAHEKANPAPKLAHLDGTPVEPGEKPRTLDHQPESPSANPGREA